MSWKALALSREQPTNIATHTLLWIEHSFGMQAMPGRCECTGKIKCLRPFSQVSIATALDHEWPAASIQAICNVTKLQG